MRRWFHILLLIPLLGLLPGCEEPLGLEGSEQDGIVLTIRCADPVLRTKADAADYNENLIKTVDFLFYPGAEPADDQDAVLHIRKDVTLDPTQTGEGTASFRIVIKQYQFDRFFPSVNSQATVYALVNFDEDYIGSLSETSKADLAARTPIVTDFTNETDYAQSCFLMDGRAVLTYNGNQGQSVWGEITVSRFAAKMTMGVNVAQEVRLKHVTETGTVEEIWRPVLHTMRVYLVDGVKTMKVSESGLDAGTDVSKFFSYSKNKRPFVKTNNEGYYIEPLSEVGGKEYIETYPMYSYPREWSKEHYDYTSVNFLDGLPPEQPYFKLELDWTRQEANGFTFDQRKYYYKILLPFESFVRNNWYAFYVDVAILGSEADEGKAVITPSCYVLEWQNQEQDINKSAVISQARYLSTDMSVYTVRNIDSFEIPFVSSHNVKVVPGSVKASRPYYGSVSNQIVGHYMKSLHGWVLQDAPEKYYLHFDNQDPQAGGDPIYEPSNWLTEQSNSIKFTHVLNNDYSLPDFDYSPYTITFKIVHEDLIPTDPAHETKLYKQYVRELTIIQYPAMYIEALRNSDTQIMATGNNDNPYGYKENGVWRLNDENDPWGYVYIDGGRFIRKDKKARGSSEDDFYKLDTSRPDNRQEYQWRTVWYTGGSRDLFKINVTVLPQDSPLIIGDPRTEEPVDLGYSYTNQVEADKNILEDHPDGFSICPSVYSDESPRRLLYYYPADDDYRTEYMVAPSFRVASKFGGTEFGQGFFQDITKKFAEYRCAAFQEDGFPGGRWRLPTKGEIMFIAKLSGQGAIERLFSFGSTYWSANGAVNVSKEGKVTSSNADKALLRCVYDSWYWGDDQHEPKTEFVWGDRLKGR